MELGKTEFKVLKFRLIAGCLYVVLYALLKILDIWKTFSESLIDWAIWEDSAATFRLLFCLLDSSFKNVYVLLEYPMQFPVFWK